MICKGIEKFIFHMLYISKPISPSFPALTATFSPILAFLKQLTVLIIIASQRNNYFYFNMKTLEFV